MKYYKIILKTIISFLLSFNSYSTEVPLLKLEATYDLSDQVQIDEHRLEIPEDTKLVVTQFTIENEVEYKRAISEINKIRGEKKFDYITAISHPENSEKPSYTYSPNQLKHRIDNIGQEFQVDPKRITQINQEPPKTRIEITSRAPSSATESSKPWWNDNKRLGDWYIRKGRVNLSIIRTIQIGGISYLGLQASGMPPTPSFVLSSTMGGLSGTLNYYNDEVSDLLGTQKYEDQVRDSIKEKLSSHLQNKFSKVSNTSLQPSKLKKVKNFTWNIFKWFAFEFAYLKVYSFVENSLNYFGQLHILNNPQAALELTAITAFKGLASQALFDISIAADFAPRSDSFDEAINVSGFRNLISSIKKFSDDEVISKSQLKYLIESKSYKYFKEGHNVHQTIQKINQDFLKTIPQGLKKELLLETINNFLQTYKISSTEAKELLSASITIKDSSVDQYKQDIGEKINQFRNNSIRPDRTDEISLQRVSETITTHKAALQLKRMAWTMAGSATWAGAAILSLTGFPEAGNMAFGILGTSGLMNMIRVSIRKPKLIRHCGDYIEP